MTRASAKPGRDICERTFRFAVSIAKLCRQIETRNGTCRVLARQLLRAATSIGANVEEAQAAQSRADFINKNSIALKEARETNYWLRLIVASAEVPAEALAAYLQESGELMRIIGAIVVSAHKAAQKR
ncbi:MAG: four helix bundle protein [Candidatus Acidiferrales bacterium]